MLNIASVNMPKIKPETKVLIIKTLKSKSPAEVADIFNVSKWQVERIRKCYQETGDVHDRRRLCRPRKTTAWGDNLLVRLSEARPMSTTSQLQKEWTPATGMPARWPSMPSPTTSSTSSTTLCQTGWQLFCRPKEPIQDIKYIPFSPWWNTRLIFHLLFYIPLEKGKMYWL